MREFTRTITEFKIIYKDTEGKVYKTETKERKPSLGALCSREIKARDGKMDFTVTIEKSHSVYELSLDTLKEHGTLVETLTDEEVEEKKAK